MAKRPSLPELRCILIEGQARPDSDLWQFFVSLVRGSGDVRVLSTWEGYEDAMLAAEVAAREHKSEQGAPLPVRDHVVRPW